MHGRAPERRELVATCHYRPALARISALIPVVPAPKLAARFQPFVHRLEIGRLAFHANREICSISREAVEIGSRRIAVATHQIRYR